MDANIFKDAANYMKKYYSDGENKQCVFIYYEFRDDFQGGTLIIAHRVYDNGSWAKTTFSYGELESLAGMWA